MAMPRSKIFLTAWFLGVLCLACATPLLASGEITAEELRAKMERGDSPLLVDVREVFEQGDFSLGGELYPLSDVLKMMSTGMFEAFQEKQKSHPTGEIVLYDTNGARSRMAQQSLEDRGLQNVKILTGGLNYWRGAFGDVTPQVRPGAPTSSPPPPAQPAPVQPSANTRANDTSTDEPMAASADDGAAFEEDQSGFDDSGNDEALDEDGAFDDEDDAAAVDDEESEGDFVPEDDPSDE
jgi:rhodanese-related sulfurtransferase